MSEELILPDLEELTNARYDQFLSILRAFFVPSLEARIYEGLETFVYSKAELSSQFPNIRKCLSLLKALVKISQDSEHPEIGLIERFLCKTFKYFIKDGLITSFLNAIVLNNRLNIISRHLDAMGVDKNFLKIFNVPRVLTSLNAPKKSGDFDPREIKNPFENNKRAIKRKASNSDDFLNEEFIPLFPIEPKNSVKKVTRKISKPLIVNKSRNSIFSSNFCDKKLKLKIDIENNEKGEFKKLKLPCKSENIIENIVNSDPSVTKYFGNIKKKFRKISNRVNKILAGIDKKKIKKCILYCKIFGNSILFKLKKRERDGCRSCLLTDRVVAQEKISENSRKSGGEKSKFRGKFEEKPEEKLEDFPEIAVEEPSFPLTLHEATKSGEIGERKIEKNRETLGENGSVDGFESFCSCRSCESSKISWESAFSSFPGISQEFSENCENLVSLNSWRPENCEISSENYEKSENYETLLEKSPENSENREIFLENREKLKNCGNFPENHEKFEIRELFSENVGKLENLRKSENSCKCKHPRTPENRGKIENSEISTEKSLENSENSGKNLRLDKSISVQENLWKNCHCKNRENRTIFTQTDSENSPKIHENPFKKSSKNRENSLICILEETEERTRRCLTSGSEEMPAIIPRSFSRSGTFIVTRSSNSFASELTKVEDFLTDLELIETLSGKSSRIFSSKIHCHCKSQKKSKLDFSNDRLHHLLPEFNKNMKIIFSTMFKHFKIIFSQRAFDKLRLLVKKKLYKLIMESEKSTNTSHTCFMVKRRRLSGSENRSDHLSRNFIDKNAGKMENHSENFEVNGSTKNSRKNRKIRDSFTKIIDKKFMKNQEEEENFCTCCSRPFHRMHSRNLGAINSCRSNRIKREVPPYTGNGRHKNRDSSSIYKLNFSNKINCNCDHLNYRENSIIDEEFREMLIEHVNLCRNVRNSLIKRIQNVRNI